MQDHWIAKWCAPKYNGCGRERRTRQNVAAIFLLLQSKPLSLRVQIVLHSTNSVFLSILCLLDFIFCFFFGFICSFQYRSSKCNGTLKITCFGGIACVTNTPCEVMNNFDRQTSTSAVSDHLLYILSFLLTSTFILVFMFLIFFLLLFIHFGRHIRAGQTLMVMIYATVLLYTVLHSTKG